MNQLTHALLCAFALLVFNACASTSQENSANNVPTPSRSPVTTVSPLTNTANTQQGAADVVSADAADAKLAAGAKGEIEIRLHIADGYHVNANPASDKFFIPTQLEVAASEGIQPGAPVYPASISKKFTFADQPLAVYEREAIIRLPLNADRATTKGTHILHGSIRVQPCNDEVCFPPRTIQTSTNVIIE